MPKIDERFLRIVALGNVQMVEVELQPIKIEADFADAHLAMNAGGDGSGQHVPQHGRNRKVSREAQKQHDRDDDHADFAHAPRTPQLRVRAIHGFAGMKNSDLTCTRALG